MTLGETIQAKTNQTAARVLRVGYTPDSDDAFNYYAWEHGKVGIEGWDVRFHRDHIIALNRGAMEERYDLAGVSSVQFPSLADRYWLLSVGNSIGRGYGPVLAAHEATTLADLRGKRIAVAGIPTTGAALARMFCPNAEFFEVRYDRIADAVAAGQFEAGVMIHEELLFFPQKGLTKVCDLGAEWTQQTGLPLPVGLNVVRRDLGRALAQEVADVCRRSLQWALDHFDEAFAFASQFGRGCSQEHLNMFSNQDTLRLMPDVREGLAVVFDRVAELGLGPQLDRFEVLMRGIEGQGTRVAELLRLKAEYLIPCVYHFYQNPPHFVAAEDCFLIDDQGRRYLDCFSGVTVMSAGHCNAEIIEPAIKQIRTLQHTTSIYLTEPVLRLAEALSRITPGDLKRSFLCASGSEAVEGALLLASLHTRRRTVIALSGGLHGRTRWAMNVTGLDMWRTDPFPLDDVRHVSFGDEAALASVMQSLDGQVAAVIGEPIQGNGGIQIPPSRYWPAVHGLCRKHGALLILDEVQTGIGRTGRWFACEHWKVTPDVMVISKALGNGFPIAAFITTGAIADSYRRPGASTHGGNPVSAVAALATLAFHEKNDLAGSAARKGERLLAQLTKLASRHSCLHRPRGRGLMIGVDVSNSQGHPDPAALDAILESLKERGFLCGKTGPDRNVLTFMPPLVVDTSDLDRCLAALDEILREREEIPS